jgi:phosphoglycerol transferase
MRHKSSLFILSVLFAFAACSSKTEEPKSKVSVLPQTSKYEASMAEGIDFKKPGYPIFIKSVQGIAGHEPWGAWTDGSVATFQFNQPLPQHFVLEISGGAWESNVNKPVGITIGEVRKEAIFKGDPFNGPETVSLDYTLTGVDDSIQIIVPYPVGGPKDTRLIGVGLISLKIISRDGK